MSTLLFWLYCITQLVVVFGSESPQVEFGDGVAKGRYLTTKNGRKFSAFMGIPYALPPLGELRFKPPIAAKPWDGILNATEVHAVCPQRDVYRRSKVIEGNEDCLYLNVYTPKPHLSEDDPLPVMIFFHGGGWICGSGNSHWYGPDVLLDRDIVLVVTNYRLGPLGFLSTGDEIVSGNNGLKDQNLALKWVKKNINKFGGDSESVTIFGESAGGASAQFHMASPMSKGLFKGAIAQSGTAFCNWALTSKEDAKRNSKKLAASLNCPTESSQEMVECLRKVNATKMIEQDEKFMEWDYDPMIPFKPVIEPDVEGAFLTEDPVEIFKSGRGAQIPLITGINTEDGALKVAGLYQNPHLLEDLDKEFEKIIPLSLMYEKVVEDTVSVTKKLRKFYLNNENINQSSINSLIHLYTDGWFLNCADTAARIHLQYSDQPVYYYLFGHRGAASFTKIFGGGDHDLGVCHADELQYLFPIGDGVFPDKTPSDEDRKVTELLTTMWANFAKTGNPTPELNDVVLEKWHPVKSLSMEYFYIDSKATSMKDGLFLERAKLWRSLCSDRRMEEIRDEL